MAKQIHPSKGKPAQGSEIFFLTGLPKSGTTWVMNILNSSEEICCLGEGRFFSSGLRNIPSLFDAIYEGIHPWHGFISLRKKNWIGLDDHITTVNRQNFLSSGALNHSLDETVDAIFRRAMSYFISRAKKLYPHARIIGDKTPVMRPCQLKRITRIFPSAKVIFLHRNAKDFIVSILFHYWRAVRDNRPDSQMEYLTPDDFLQVEKFVNAQNKHAIEFVREDTAIKLAGVWKELKKQAGSIKQNSPDTFLTVSYEKLFRNPVTIAEIIFSFLGVDVSRNQLNDFIEKNSINAIKRTENNFLKTHVRSGRPEDWKKYLSDSISRRIDEYIE